MFVINLEITFGYEFTVIKKMFRNIKAWLSLGIRLE